MQTKDKNLLHHLGDWWSARASTGTMATHGVSRGMKLFRWLMPNGGTLLIVSLLLLSQTVWAESQATEAPTYPAATTINYQGTLANAAGEPLTGVHSVTVALYDSAENGNLLWGPETHAGVSVQNGRFNIAVGSQTTGGVPTILWNGERYLEITVDNETLTPREVVRSVPIAGMALTVPDGIITKAKLAPNVIPNYYFQAFSNSTHTIVGDTTVTFVDSVDPDNLFENHTFTAPVSGIYYLSTIISFEGGDGADDTYELVFLKNGIATELLLINPRAWTRSGLEAAESNMAIMQLSAGDTVNVRVNNVNANDLIKMRSRRFIGFYLGE